VSDVNTEAGFTEALAAQAGKTPAEPEAAPADTEPRTRPEQDSALRVVQDVLEDDDSNRPVSEGLAFGNESDERTPVFQIHNPDGSLDRTFEKQDDGQAYLDAENARIDAEARTAQAHSLLLERNVEQLIEDGYADTDPPLIEAATDWARRDAAGFVAWLNEEAERERYELSERLDDYDLSAEELADEMARIEAEPTEADQLRAVVEAQLREEHKDALVSEIAQTQTQLSEKEDRARGGELVHLFAGMSEAEREQAVDDLAGAATLFQSLGPEEMVLRLGGDPTRVDDLMVAADLCRPIEAVPAESYGEHIARVSAVVNAVRRQVATEKFHEALLNEPDSTIASGLETPIDRQNKLLEEFLYAEDTPAYNLRIEDLKKIGPRRAATVGDLRREVAAAPKLLDGLTSNGKPTTPDDLIARGDGFKSARDKHEHEQKETRRRDQALFGR